MKLICNISPDELKTALKQRKVSYREIGSKLGLSEPVVSDIINGIYEGSEDTKNRVLIYIDSIISDRLDMNIFVYDHTETFLKMTQTCIEHKNFSLDEKITLVKFYEDLKKSKILK